MIVIIVKLKRNSTDNDKVERIEFNHGNTRIRKDETTDKARTRAEKKRKRKRPAPTPSLSCPWEMGTVILFVAPPFTLHAIRPRQAILRILIPCVLPVIQQADPVALLLPVGQDRHDPECVRSSRSCLSSAVPTLEPVVSLKKRGANPGEGRLGESTRQEKDFIGDTGRCSASRTAVVGLRTWFTTRQQRP